MPALVHAVAIAWIAVGCVLALLVESTSATASRLLTEALIMGGTLQPTPDQSFIDMAINDFITPTLDPELSPFHGTALTYPASAGIVSGPFAPTINQSVDIGVANLDAALAQQPAGKPVVAFGFSQSTVVTMEEKAALEARKARGETVPDVVFVGIGVGNRPNGGITTRLQGVTIPIFDFTFNGPEPTGPEFGFKTIDIVREYDGLADFPLYPINLLADANALLGVLFVHAAYNEVSLDPSSPKYVPGTTVQQKGDTTFYTIPTADLPLFDPLRMVGVPESVIDVFEPAAKAIIDTAYDRTIPYGDPTPAKLVPQIDPVKFTGDLAQAVGTGIDNALHVVSPRVEKTDDAGTVDIAKARSAEAESQPVNNKKSSRVRDDDAVAAAGNADIADTATAADADASETAAAGAAATSATADTSAAGSK